MNTAIRVRNLSKRYRIDRNRHGLRYSTLRDAIVKAITSKLGRLVGARKAETFEDFWALRDVSFEVEPGEVVGIIGRNGAGKSTLLKVLSRITKPTTGRVELRGRVSSLLEVGTGFHHELTGRENIYLNGSILGMSKGEIDRKFDEIVSFAGVEQFLETPVKRYSTGMYVRLAFAVAAHLEPEIMIVDEVLAVGDADFQQKCFDKMEQVAKSGRTVFLVSHQLNIVRRLCHTGILLDKGRLMTVGKADGVIESYLAANRAAPRPRVQTLFEDAPRPDTTGLARFRSAQYTGADLGCLRPDGPLEVTIQIDSKFEQTATHLALTLADRYGAKLIHVDIKTLGRPVPLKLGPNLFAIRIRSLHLMPGIYTVGLSLTNDEEIFDRIPEAFQLEVVDDSIEPIDPKTLGLVSCQFDILALE